MSSSGVSRDTRARESQRAVLLSRPADTARGVPSLGAPTTHAPRAPGRTRLERSALGAVAPNGSANRRQLTPAQSRQTSESGGATGGPCQLELTDNRTRQASILGRLLGPKTVLLDLLLEHLPAQAE